MVTGFNWRDAPKGYGDRMLEFNLDKILEKDYTPGGIRLAGAYENDRNAQNRALYTEILREACGTDQTIIAHHLVYTVTEKRADGDYFLVIEIPSADSLIFDHVIMAKIFGESFHDVLRVLACEPVNTRDAKLAEFFYDRKGKETVTG